MKNKAILQYHEMIVKPIRLWLEWENDDLICDAPHPNVVRSRAQTSKKKSILYIIQAHARITHLP